MDLDTERSKQPLTKGKIVNYILLALIIASGLFYINKENVLGKLVENRFQQTSKTPPTTSNKPIEPKKLLVNIEGAIANPGVYELEEDARVNDLLLKSGGFTADVDTKFVSQNLNKAQKLTDGMKIYIPKINETPQAGTASQSFNASTTANKTINLNTASKDELNSLSGVGDATSEKIIKARPYSKVEDLVTKKVISQTILDKIKDNLTI